MATKFKGRANGIMPEHSFAAEYNFNGNLSSQPEVLLSNFIKQLARAFNLANVYISQSGVHAKTTDFSLHIDVKTSRHAQPLLWLTQKKLVFSLFYGALFPLW